MTTRSLIIFILIAAFTFTRADAAGNLDELSQITPNSEGLLISFPSEGSNFSYQINQGRRLTGAYGEQILVPNGKAATLISENLSISISPTGDTHVWVVTKRRDLRPMGGAIVYECFKINTTTGVIVFEDNHVA